MSRRPKTSNAEEIILRAAESWPSKILTRQQVSIFSGGLVAPGTLANADSQGVGPENAFKVGRHVAYPIESVTAWLISRLSV